MEVEGPLYDDSTTAGFRLLFGDLPLDSKSSVVSSAPEKDEPRLMRAFLARAYRAPRVDEADVKRFVALVEDQRNAGLSFTEAMIAGYTAVLASPKFLYLNEKPGPLDDYALATRLSLFLWNSLPDDELRARADRSELGRPAILRAETERMLADPKSRRFVEAFLDYWIDLRKIEDSTPSASLYNDYYLDDALTEAAVAESQLYFEDMLRHDLPMRNSSTKQPGGDSPNHSPPDGGASGHRIRTAVFPRRDQSRWPGPTLRVTWERSRVHAADAR